MQLDRKDAMRPRPRKTEKLSRVEFEALQKFIKMQPTKYDAQILIGISAPTMDAVLFKKGQGAPTTIAKIRAAINSPQQTA